MRNNEYNALTHTFVSEPIINSVWNDLAKDTIGTTPVLLGTDNWFVTALDSEILQRPFYNRVGGISSNADMTCYFYKNDRIYINDLTLFCNFADGLVKQSDIIVTPLIPPVIDQATLPNYEILNKMIVEIATFYMTVNSAGVNEVKQASQLLIPVNHFNSVNNLQIFAPENTGLIKQTNLCQWLEIRFFKPNLTTSFPSYSTKSIDTGFQTDRCLVWAEANLSHTYVTADRDDVLIGPSATGWPD